MNQADGMAANPYMTTPGEFVVIEFGTYTGVDSARARFTSGGIDYCKTLTNTNFDGYGSYQDCAGILPNFNGSGAFSTIHIDIEVSGSFEVCVSALDVVIGP